MPDPVSRVLLFGTEFPPSAAGTAAYARCLALALHGQGVDVADRWPVYPENTWEGSTLLHVNTTLLRKSVEELFHAFLDALELARTAS